MRAAAFLPWLVGLPILGWVPSSLGSTAERGRQTRVPDVAPVGDPTDVAGVRRLIRAFGMEPVGLAIRPEHPCRPRQPPILALLPRGDVRVEDLGTYVVEMDFEEEIPDANLVAEFWLADRLLDERRFEERLRHDRFILAATALVPRAVLEAPRAEAEEFFWRIDPGMPGAAQARFRIVPPDPRLEARLTEIDHGLRAEPWTVSHQVRAQALLDAGLDVAALRAAEQVIDVAPMAGQALAIASAALCDMGLGRSQTGEDVMELARRLPAEAQAILVPAARDRRRCRPSVIRPGADGTGGC